MFLLLVSMVFVFGNGEGDFMQQQQNMANDGDQFAPNTVANCDLSSVDRYRENRRRRRYQRQANATPLVFQPRQPRLQLQPPPPPPAREVDLNKMRLLFEKQLQISDIRVAGRIVIPKSYAEMCLPTLTAKEGVWMHFNDLDFRRVWTFRFRYWPNNSTRMYVFENAREFVRVHGLGFGDFIMVFKDDVTGSYVLSGRYNIDQVVNHSMNANSSSNTNYFPTANSNSNTNYFPTVNSNSSANYFSTANLNSNANYFPTANLNSNTNNFPIANVNSNTNYFPAANVNSDANYFPTANLNSNTNNFTTANSTSNANCLPTLDEYGSPDNGDSIDYLMNLFDEEAPDLSQLDLSPALNPSTN